MDRYDARWADEFAGSIPVARDWGGRAGPDPDCPREFDAADPFTGHVDLPRGQERELSVDRERTYALSGGESRALAISVNARRAARVQWMCLPCT